jgi:hypothetical protein
MVVGFTTIYAISAYHHWCCEFESWSGRGVQHYVRTASIRDVIAFPKSTEGRDPMSKAPAQLSQSDLDLYHIQVKPSWPVNKDSFYSL